MRDYDVPVLIVGGSLVGMTAAALLGNHGVPSLVVERHRGSAIHPRAALILQRSMEILRSIGIEDQILAKSAEQFDQDAAIMSVESLAGEEIAWHLPKLNDGVRDLSPCERTFASQIAVEPVLSERARQLGAKIRFGTELVSFDQDDDGVTAVIKDRNSGATSTVRARYMIAADGSHSTVRDHLSIGTSGRGVLSKSITIYFRADVQPLLRERNLGVIMVVNPVLQGFFRIEKPYKSGFLAVHGLGDPQAPDSDIWADLTDERCVELVRSGLGDSTINVEIDDVMRWEARTEVADRWQKGRVFLAGDAAHVMPPYGGYGGNTGIHDAQNLAWKLAKVLQGDAHPALLSTYEQERKPVAAFTVEQAYTRYVTRAAPFLAVNGMAKVVSDANFDLGYRYGPADALTSSNDADEVHADPRQTKGAPGSRAPHHALRRDNELISTLDLFGTDFVLLTGPENTKWSEGARVAAERLGVRLDVHTIGGPGEYIDPTGDFGDAYGVTPSGAVLVRPDGFVAWRSTTDADAADLTVADVLENLLSRSTSKGGPASGAIPAPLPA